jgi:hypothetical protein
MFKSARSDDDVQTEIFVAAFFSTVLPFFPVDRASEPWIQIALVTKSSPEERADAFNVPIEIPLSHKSVRVTRSISLGPS